MNKMNSTMSVSFNSNIYKVHTVSDYEACRGLVQQIRHNCASYPVLGFDCEWWSTQGSQQRRKIALLQLACPGGLCVLIRLCRMPTIPPELANLLKDNQILKVGIQPLDDGIKLMEDYGLQVKKTLDLRHLAKRLNISEPYGLAILAEKTLGTSITKDWHLPASNWEAPVLKPDQTAYASKDAIAGYEIFRVYNQKISFNEMTKFYDLPY